MIKPLSSLFKKPFDVFEKRARKTKLSSIIYFDENEYYLLALTTDFTSSSIR